jgi:hypothetical protein
MRIHESSLLDAAFAYFAYSAVALAASVAALPRCVLCGSFSSAIEGCSTEKSVEKVKGVHDRILQQGEAAVSGG